MNKNITIMVIKNDAIRKHLENKIIADIRKHFNILAKTRKIITRKIAKQLKRREWEQNWHPYPTQTLQNLSANYEAQEVLALLCESIEPNKFDAIQLGRSIKGDHYIAQKCSKNTIRGKYADHKQWQNILLDKNGACILMGSNNKAISLAPNIVHSVDSVDELKEHMYIFFPALRNIFDKSNSRRAITKLVKYANLILNKTPPDLAHDINHHRRVWSNARYIMNKERVVDHKRIVFLSSFWHDINKHEFIADPSLIYLSMTNDKVTSDIIKDTITNHQWKSKPKSLFARTLFDADKIEYISTDRWQSVLFKEPHDSNTKLYFEGLNLRLPILPARLHSQTAKNIYYRRYKKFIQWAESNNLYKNNRFTYKEI